MADVFSKGKRSEVMALIRGSGNESTELRMILLMRAHGIKGWRRHQNVFGKPDFVFGKQRVALFVDGCFWHGCPRCYQAPKERAEFWRKKIQNNKKRDQRVNRQLRVEGWSVLRVLECSLRKRPEATAMRVLRILKKRENASEFPIPSRMTTYDNHHAECCETLQKSGISA